MCPAEDRDLRIDGAAKGKHRDLFRYGPMLVVRRGSNGSADIRLGNRKKPSGFGRNPRDRPGPKGLGRNLSRTGPSPHRRGIWIGRSGSRQQCRLSFFCARRGAHRLRSPCLSKGCPSRFKKRAGLRQPRIRSGAERLWDQRASPQSGAHWPRSQSRSAPSSCAPAGSGSPVPNPFNPTRSLGAKSRSVVPRQGVSTPLDTNGRVAVESLRAPRTGRGASRGRRRRAAVRSPSALADDNRRPRHAPPASASRPRSTRARSARR